MFWYENYMRILWKFRVSKKISHANLFLVLYSLSYSVIKIKYHFVMFSFPKNLQVGRKYCVTGHNRGSDLEQFKPGIRFFYLKVSCSYRFNSFMYIIKIIVFAVMRGISILLVNLIYLQISSSFFFKLNNWRDKQ